MFKLFEHKRDSERLYLLKEILNTLRDINDKLDAQPKTKQPENTDMTQGKRQRPSSSASLSSKETVLSTLNSYFEKKQLGHKDIAEKTGLLEINVRNILTGKHNISPKVAQKLSDAFGFRKEYLLEGDGRLLPQKTVSREQERSIERHYQNKYGD